jgi:hypothetical protein
MWRGSVIAITALISACAESHSFAIGPTIDGDGHVGIEAAEAVGPIVSGGESALDATDLDATGKRVAASFVVTGIRGAFGATNARPYGVASVGFYVEYLRLGVPASPWGYHATVSLNASTHGRGALFCALTMGPNRVATLRTRDTNEGDSTGVFTNGLDASVRYYARPGQGWGPWQLGLFYVRQDTWLYP